MLLGGPLGSPASCSPGSSLGGTGSHPPPTGDPKGPPNPSSTTLAPTDGLASCLTSRLRVMPMRADQSAVCAINRHLQCMEDPYRGWPGYFVKSHYRPFVDLPLSE